MTSRRPVWTSSRSSHSNRESSAFSDKVLNPAISASGIGQVGEKYEVNISKIYHPTFFWVQHAKSVETIKRLQSELNSHYDNNSYPPFKPLVNTFCVYIHRGQCYRVFVRKSTAKGFLVHCVDFGYQLMANEKVLRPIEGKFCSQPFGAILCSLADVVPYNTKLWTNEETEYFRSKVKSNVVTIRLVFKSLARLFVHVFDPDSSDGRVIQTALVAKGMAKDFHAKFFRSETTLCIDEMLDVPSMPTAELPLADDSKIGLQNSSEVHSREDNSVQNQSSEF